MFAGVLITDRRERRILLGKKRRGFGTHLWQHSFCGKPEASDADLMETARRELREESGLTVGNRDDLRWLGLFRYEFTEERDLPFNMEVHIYTCDLEATSGSVMEETPEILPRWHGYGEVPFSQMWPDNRHWLPDFLAGSRSTEKIKSAYFLYESLTSVRDYHLEWHNQYGD